MTIFDWICAIFGMVFGLAVTGLVCYDCYLATNGIPTISKRIATLVHDNPVPGCLLAASLALQIGYVLGCLTGHLFFPEQPN
jgi:hypothetical protein